MEPRDVPARDKLHHAIRRCFSTTIAKHFKANYEAHPEWFDDERARKGTSALLDLLHNLLNEVDKFEISDKSDLSDGG